MLDKNDMYRTERAWDEPRLLTFKFCATRIKHFGWPLTILPCLTKVITSRQSQGKSIAASIIHGLCDSCRMLLTVNPSVIPSHSTENSNMSAFLILDCMISLRLVSLLTSVAR